MKRLLLCAFLLVLCGCPSPNKVIMSSIQDSWEAMKPYAVAGIQTATDLSTEAREELVNEANELSKTLEHEVEHGE